MMVFKQHDSAGVVEIEDSAFGAEVVEPTTGSGSLGAIVLVPARTRGARSRRNGCGLKQKYALDVCDRNERLPDDNVLVSHNA